MENNVYKNPNSTRNTQPKPKSKGKIVLIVVLFVFVVVLISSVIGYLYVTSEIEGERNLGNSEVIVEVPEGASLQAISVLLNENNVIRSSTIFDLYIKITGDTGNVQYGPHSVTPEMSYSEIIDALGTPYIINVPGEPITFPEGTTALKMALMLEEVGFFTVDEFIDECNNGTFTGNVFPLISDNPDKFIKLEGFLFPETYMYYEDMTANAFIQQMLDTFEQLVLTEENMAKIEQSALTLEEIIALSSIVEKESVGAESYPMVASVFYNRLNNPDIFPTLESDTACDWRKRGYPDLGGFFPGVLQYYYDGYENIPEGTKAGYDTYSRPGIPIGAICNPGIIAIEGTLNPAETEYFFFFTGIDQKTFYFNVTNAEHEADYRLYGP